MAKSPEAPNSSSTYAFHTGMKGYQRGIKLTERGGVVVKVGKNGVPSKVGKASVAYIPPTPTPDYVVAMPSHLRRTETDGRLDIAGGTREHFNFSDAATLPEITRSLVDTVVKVPHSKELVRMHVAAAIFPLGLSCDGTPENLLSEKESIAGNVRDLLCESEELLDLLYFHPIKFVEAKDSLRRLEEVLEESDSLLLDLAGSCDHGNGDDILQSLGSRASSVKKRFNAAKAYVDSIGVVPETVQTRLDV